VSLLIPPKKIRIFGFAAFTVSAPRRIFEYQLLQLYDFAVRSTLSSGGRSSLRKPMETKLGQDDAYED
jgi:hypothetical protein